MRVSGGAVALGLGLWISLQLWPHWVEFRNRQPATIDAAPAAAPAYLPPPAPDKQTSTLGTEASISERPLQLVLVATSPAPRLLDSTASLGTDPRNPQTYVGGAILSNGARIVEIQPDRIVLLLNGRHETLMVDKTAASRAAMNSAAEQQRSGGGASSLTQATKAGVAGSATSVGGIGPAAASRTRVSRPDLSEFMRPQPVFENGKVAGLKILPGANLSRLAALGVESGDVIRTIEGTLIESADSWQRIDDALSSGESIVVGIERRGSLVSISLDGSRLFGAPST